MSAPGNVRRASDSRDDWETPPELFNKLNAEFRFTLDAAASPENRKCERYLTADEDALHAPVFDHVVWCNPPYGKGLSEWVRAFERWQGNGCTVVALLPAATDTGWFGYVWQAADEVRFLSGRVQFIGSTSSNPSGSIVAVYRPRAEPFTPQAAPRCILWDWRG